MNSSLCILFEAMHTCSNNEMATEYDRIVSQSISVIKTYLRVFEVAAVCCEGNERAPDPPLALAIIRTVTVASRSKVARTVAIMEKHSIRAHQIDTGIYTVFF